MKKLCILRCLEKSTWCTGASCLKAFKDRNYGFEKLTKEDYDLVAVWTCNGCGEYILKDEDGSNIRKKIERIIKMQTDVLYLSPCTCEKDTGKLCPKISEIAAELENSGVAIIEGKE